MAANVYEGMYILESTRYVRDPDAASGLLEEMIRKAGGEILVSRLWEERRLAYPINGHRKGAYWLIYFKIEAGQIAGIRRQCQINDLILRTLFLKVDPRIVDAVVAHAQTATPSSGEGVAHAEDEEPAAVGASDAEPEDEKGDN